MRKAKQRLEACGLGAAESAFDQASDKFRGGRPESTEHILPVRPLLSFFGSDPAMPGAQSD